MSTTYNADIAEIAAEVWAKLATYEGEDADAQLIIEKAILTEIHKRHDIERRLVAVARTAWSLCDGTEESGSPRVRVFKCDRADFEALSNALDALDELPEVSDLIAATGPAKAEHFLDLVPSPHV